MTCSKQLPGLASVWVCRANVRRWPWSFWQGQYRIVHGHMRHSAFTGDKLEALCLLTNKVVKTQPPQVVNYALIFHPLLSFSWPPFPTFILDISTVHAYVMSSTGLMSHSSWMISDDVALTSGSQVNIFRINLRNISFSSPGGIVVTKSSKEVLGIGGLDIQLPVVIECQVHLVQSSD
jgi:hypothetical protein